MTRHGYGFVGASEGDYYVGARDIGGAMHGDAVLIRPDAKCQGASRSARVMRVAERANTHIVGRFEQLGTVGIVVPADKRFCAEVFISEQGASGAKSGDYVVARLTGFPTRHSPAQGSVEEVIGREDDPGIGVEVIIREHGLETGFSADALAQAAGIELDVTAALDSDPTRRDIRDRFVFTIDPVDARDFDDAVSIEHIDGLTRLGVHIADVGHYVPWGSAIDVEARCRATSVYLVDRVLPMLPEKLSNDICSLNPGSDRLTFSADIWLDKHGVVQRYELYSAAIRSNARFAYEDVQAMLEGRAAFPDAQAEQALRSFARVAARLGARRVARGGLDFETVEAKVRLADDGAPLEVILRERTQATAMIEEAMILANEVVAAHMRDAAVPMLYRIHEDPDSDALERVAAVLKEFGYLVKDVRNTSSATLQRIIAYAHDRPEKRLINALLLRALKRARYVDYLARHFGLASAAYTHFTSPIRRYPDLIVHRLLRAQLAEASGIGKKPAGTSAAMPGAGKGPVGMPKGGGGGAVGAEAALAVAGMVPELSALAAHSSAMEREAALAEEESVRLKLCELMVGHVGEVFDGVVTGVVGFGFFVQLENTVEGFVHTRSLPDDYYTHDAKRFFLRGEETGKGFRLGQPVRVRIENVVPSDARIDMRVV